MKNASRLVLATLLALPVLVAAGCGGSESVPDSAVAVVDGTEVTRAEFDALFDRARKSYQLQKQDFPKAGSTEYQSLQTQAVAYLVQRIEYEQEAEELGITVSQADVDKREQQVLDQSFGGDRKKLQTALEQQGYTQAEFRADLRSLAIRDKLVAAVTKDVKVSDADVKAFYDQNIADYTVPESRAVRHILLTVRTKDGKVDYPASREQADDIYRQLQNGGDFAALAKKYSQDPGSKDNGGKYTVARGQTVAPFEQTAFNLDTGVVSRPVKTEYGYHLIEPVGPVKVGRVKPLSEVKKSISDQLRSDKQNEAVTEWAAKVRKDYEGKVQYAAGFEPPAEVEETDTGTTAPAQD
jgi:parvulin-like peptidyl-prolyl isomerase